MVYSIILFSIVFVGLVVATISDLRTREVPDWVSYGLIFTGVALHVLFAIVFWDVSYLLRSISGLAVFVVFALVMFYSGQWGGGDAKLLMGLGALIGLDWEFSRMPFLLSFFTNMLVLGAAYGFVWSFFLVIKHWKKFIKEVRQQFVRKPIKKIKMILFYVTIFIVFSSLFVSNLYTRFTILMLGAVCVVAFVLWIMIKAVEKVCMIKAVAPTELTEGDWIVKDVKYNGKYICGPKDLGIERKAIRQLRKLYAQGNMKKIVIKEGIPFVPSFLMAFVFTFLWGNIIFYFI